MKELLWRSTIYTLVVHLGLGILFMIGFFLKREEYGHDYFNDAIYFNFMFLQFLPVTFAILFACLLIYKLIKRRE